MRKPQTTAVTVCPVCRGEVEIREVECRNCDIQVRGHFGTGSRYDQLNTDQQRFLETFLRCRGILRDVEATLGISYPTVRARLDLLLSALGFSDLPAGAAAGASVSKLGSVPIVDQSEPLSAGRKKILEDLDAGRITPNQAIEQMNVVRD